jgi:hypothetical protein
MRVGIALEHPEKTMGKQRRGILELMMMRFWVECVGR